ncbi:MAG: bifunctional (p)ppGpp synthetase/guanosine-3',5'-bis(diphosphate) 3'-pyrophosphohydrolase [Lachnospiraceae bacterium]|nr:bifunctional (p)ppGpp synthetase/guanosine-3',5'-bis(diphosphate) 3'-pyrophosphohydrolase [Lachnospiraceae bacterium]
MTIFDEAIIFAVKAHEGQLRKNDSMPYITHPIEVAAITSTITNDVVTLSAAMLHDVIEDTIITEEELERQFGKEVCELVLSETENKHYELPAEATWRQRKEESLKVLRNSTDRRVKIVWVADKLSNMRAFTRQYKRVGDSLWQNYNMKDKSQQHWYYSEVLKATEELREYYAWRELNELVGFVFEGKKPWETSEV